MRSRGEASGAPLRFAAVTLPALGFAAAFAVGVRLIRPLDASPVGYDTASSVLYFTRLVQGALLEQPYWATPKPALTVIDGILQAVGGWRAVSVAAIGAWAAAAILAGALLTRLSGLGAGVFAFVAVVGSAALLQDVSLAYAVSWGCLWLLLAAHAGLSDRFGLSGVFLCLAVLTRFEAIAIAAGAMVAVGAWWLAARSGRTRPVPRRAWLLGLACAAIPIMCVHDWLLIRDPLYWANVSARFSAEYPGSVGQAPTIARWAASALTASAAVAVLAAVGVAVAAARRQWRALVVVSMPVLAISAFLVLLAARGTYVSSRYLDIARIAVALTAALGFGALELADGLYPSRLRAWRRPIGEGVFLVLALGVSAIALSPLGFRAPAVRTAVNTQVSAGANLYGATPVIQRALQQQRPVAGPVLTAPGLWTPRLLVDLGLQIPQVAVNAYTPAGDAFQPGSLHPGQLVYHDRAAEPSNAATAQMESGSGAVVVGGTVLDLVASDSRAGWWLYRVASASQPTGWHG